MIGSQRRGAREKNLGLVEQRIPFVEPVQVHHLVAAQSCNARQSVDVVGIEIESLPEQLDRASGILSSFDVVGLSPCAHDQVDHFPAVVRAPALGFGADHFDSDTAGQTGDNLVLHLQDVLAFLVEAVGAAPTMRGTPATEAVRTDI